MFLVCFFQQLAVRTGVSVVFSIVGHVFPSADVCAILLLFLLLVIAGLYHQLRPVFFFKPTVIFFTFIAGIHDCFPDPVSFIGRVQLLHKGNQGMRVITVRGDVIADDEFIAGSRVDIVARLPALNSSSAITSPRTVMTRIP